jgi:hypothetical protein
VSGQLHTPATLSRGRRSLVPIGYPRSCLDDMEKRKFLTLPGLQLCPLSLPACSQSLLSYLGSSKCQLPSQQTPSIPFITLIIIILCLFNYGASISSSIVSTYCNSSVILKRKYFSLQMSDLCPLCLSKGRKSVLKYFQMNLTEVARMCAEATVSADLQS